MKKILALMAICLAFQGCNVAQDMSEYTESGKAFAEDAVFTFAHSCDAEKINEIVDPRILEQKSTSEFVSMCENIQSEYGEISEITKNKMTKISAHADGSGQSVRANYELEFMMSDLDEPFFANFELENKDDKWTIITLKFE